MSVRSDAVAPESLATVATADRAVAHPDAPLREVRALDLTDPLGAYAGRLLALLGADVLRVDDVHQRSTQRAPYLPGRSDLSTYDLYVNENKARIELDLTAEAGRARLAELMLAVDAVLWSSLDGPTGPTWELLRAVRPLPRTVVTCVTPFGLDGPYSRYRASDAVLMAMGGMLSLAGYPDQPVVPFGEQALYAASLHAAFGTVLALAHLRRTGEGQAVEVSAQEAVAHALENAVQFVDLEGRVRERIGSAEPEAGTGVFACNDGHVFVMSSLQGAFLGWEALVAWIEENRPDLAAELRGQEWADPMYRTTSEAKDRFRRIFETFATPWPKRWLYEQGQNRGANIAPLATPADVCTDPHLAARGFFDDAASAQLGETVRHLGPPFRMAGVQAHWRDWRVAPEVPEAMRRSSARPRPGGAGLRRRVLEGIRVVDFTWVGVGPFATKFLADNGADVIKVESATRVDPIRMMRPAAGGAPGVNRSGYFANRNTNKRSITVDLKSSEGLDIVQRLIAQSDVVINNFRPGVMERRGLSYENVRALRPDVVYVDMPMMGAGGPYAEFGGYGMVMTAVGGLFAMTRLPGRQPVGTGTNYPDHVPNPLHASLAIVAALVRRQDTGDGAYIELAQLESTLALLGPALMNYLAGGADPEPPGNTHPEAIQGVFRCADGGWCAVTVPFAEGPEALARALDRPEWVGGGFPSDDEVTTVLEDWLGARSARSAMDRLQASGVAAGIVQDARQMLEDPQLRHRGHWVRLAHAEMESCVYDAPVARLSVTPARLVTGAPLLGEHTREVCAELLGIVGERFDQLRRRGTFD